MAVKYSKSLHFIISDYTWSFSDHSLLFLDAGVIFYLVSEIADIPDPSSDWLVIIRQAVTSQFYSMGPGAGL